MNPKIIITSILFLLMAYVSLGQNKINGSWGNTLVLPEHNYQKLMISIRVDQESINTNPYRWAKLTGVIYAEEKEQDRLQKYECRGHLLDDYSFSLVCKDKPKDYMRIELKLEGKQKMKGFLWTSFEKGTRYDMQLELKKAVSKLDRA